MFFVFALRVKKNPGTLASLLVTRIHGSVSKFFDMKWYILPLFLVLSFRAQAPEPTWTFKGVECHPFSLYPDKVCPIKGMCPIDGPSCVAWRTGRLNLASVSAPGPKSKCASYDGDGEFDRGVWHYRDKSCSLSWYSTALAHRALTGKQITFAGDSVIRQVFLRLVWHLRDIEVIVEHFFHDEAAYVCNATHDVFLIGRNAIADATTMILQPNIRLYYIFSPFVGPHSTQINQLQQVEREVEKVVFFGVNHWDPTNPKVGTNYTYKRTTEELEVSAKTSKFILYATPELNRLQIDCFNTPSKYTEKNAFFREWMLNHGNLIVPVDKMDRTHAFFKNALDNTHYQCQFLAYNYQKLEKDAYKTPMTGDCRDMFNLNVVQITINMIF